MKHLENNCIELKDLNLKYIGDMFEYAKDESVGKSAGFTPHKNQDETIKMMTMLIETNEVWGIYHKRDKKLIGTIGVHAGKNPITKLMVHGIGFELNPNYWGKGIMSMACDLVLEHYFIDLNELEIYANHFEFNNRSRKFITKYGMEFVGNWHRASLSIDNSLYKMTKSEFIQRRGK